MTHTCKPKACLALTHTRKLAKGLAYLEEQARVSPQHLAVLQQLPQQRRRASELLRAADVLSYLC